MGCLEGRRVGLMVGELEGEMVGAVVGAVGVAVQEGDLEILGERKRGGKCERRTERGRVNKAEGG